MTAPAALALASRGLRVHPLTGKVPVLRDWPHKATSHTDEVRRLWRRHPNANVGVATGRGLIVLDIDTAKGGEQSIATLTARHGRLPTTPVVRTGGGGWHVYLGVAAPVPNSAGRLGPGLDVRGDGGQVAAPPSLHPSGRRYEWVEGRSLDDLPIAPAPLWLLAALANERRPAPASRPPPEPARASVLERARRYLARMPPSISGSGGHQAAWAAALTLVQGFQLSNEDAFALLEQDFNPRCEPPWSPRELAHKVRSAAEQARCQPGWLLADRRAA